MEEEPLIIAETIQVEEELLHLLMEEITPFQIEVVPLKEEPITMLPEQEG